MGALLGRLTARRRQCVALAGRSTLNRLELFTEQSGDRYHKITPDPEAMDRLWVDVFLEEERRAPKRIVLNLDATDDPLHGKQEDRFFHGYYNHYCYLSVPPPPLAFALGLASCCRGIRHKSLTYMVKSAPPFRVQRYGNVSQV